MQAPSHIITSLALLIFLNKNLKNEKHKKIIILILVFLSHGALDVLYPLTYHPRTALINDGFWLFFHTNVLCLTILLLSYYRKYIGIMLLSLLPDIEWFIIHPLNYFFRLEIKPFLHSLFFPYKDILILYGIDFTTQPYASFVEILYFIVIGTFFYLNKPSVTSTKHYYEPKQYPMKNMYEAKDSWLDVIQIYQTAQDHEQNIRQHYQNAFLVIESALLGVFLIINTDLDSSIVTILSMFGLFCCWLFGAPCKFRARNVDHWRMSIVKIVENTNLVEVFDAGKYRWFAFGKKGLIIQDLFGHWFETIIISIVHLIWLYINFQYNTYLIYSLISYISFIGWIILLLDPDFQGEVIREGLLY